MFEVKVNLILKLIKYEKYCLISEVIWGYLGT